MSRIRTIKPSFFHDLVIGGLPIPTRLTYVGLWTYVDDAGRGVDDARLIKAELWPLDDNYTTKKVEKDLEMLAKGDRICRYEVEGRRYLHIVRWSKHQRINRPQSSVIDHCGFTEHSVNPHCNGSANSPPDHGTLSDHSLLEGKGREGNPPTPLGGGRRTASALSGRRPASENSPGGPQATATLEAQRVSDLLKSVACGQCDLGWRTMDDGSVVRCSCQNGAAPDA